MGAYDEDFYAWAIEQAALLRSGRLQEVDVGNVAEEIESLGRSEGASSPAGLPCCSRIFSTGSFSRNAGNEAGG